jgi:hypothetical protein
MLPPACRATPPFGSGHRAGIAISFYVTSVGRRTCLCNTEDLLDPCWLKSWMLDQKAKKKVSLPIEWNAQ